MRQASRASWILPVLILLAACLDSTRTTPAPGPAHAAALPGGDVPLECLLVDEMRNPLSEGTCRYEFGEFVRALPVNSEGIATLSVPLNSTGTVRGTAEGRIERTVQVRADVAKRIEITLVPGTLPPTSSSPPPTGNVPSVTPTFGASVTLPDSRAFAEPSIAAALDGTLYVAAPGTSVWRSRDRGATWTRVADTLGTGGDADIAVDADGIVYGSDLNSQAPVSVSTDGAESFAYKTETNDGGNLDREWIAASGHGHVFATVRDGNDEELSISHDRGKTFSAPVKIITNAGTRGNIYAASDLDLYIPYDDGDLHLAVSHDGGATWTLRDVAAGTGTDCIFPAVARDAAGTLYTTWCRYGGVGTSSSNQARIYFSRSLDDGRTWTPPLVLSDDARYNTFPWIVAGNAGRVFVAWYEGVPTLPDLVPLRDPTLGVLVDWHVEVAWSLAADGDAPNFQRQAVTDVTHTGPVCTGGTGCPPTTRSLLDFFEIAEMPGGNLAFTYAGDVSGSPLEPRGLAGSQLYALVQNGGSNLRG